MKGDGCGGAECALQQMATASERAGASTSEDGFIFPVAEVVLLPCSEIEFAKVTLASKLQGVVGLVNNGCETGRSKGARLLLLRSDPGLLAI